MTTMKSPPGPPASGDAGNSVEYHQDPLGFLARCARDYGDVVRLQFDRPIYLLNRADLVEEVLQNKRGIFAKDLSATDHQGGHNPEALKYEVFRTLLGDNVLTAEGDDWRRRRRILAPPFHHEQSLSYVPAIIDHCQRLIAGWQDGQTLELREQMMELTLGIVSTALMGIDISGEAKEEGLAFRAALEHFYVPSPDGDSFRQALDRLHSAADRIITERRDGPRTNDLLCLMLHADDDEHQLTDEDLRNELLTFLFAGHETTANALTWTWGLLAQHPDKAARLQDELQTVLAGHTPAADDLPQLSYTQMVIQESLRLYPPSWFLGRFAQQDWEADDYQLAAGTGVMVSQWVLHRDARSFDQPDDFEPERWANDFEHRLPRGAYFPFGDGTRVCIGRPLAQMELALAVATIAQAFEIALSPGQQLVPEPMNTIRPKGGLTVHLKRR